MESSMTKVPMSEKAPEIKAFIEEVFPGTAQAISEQKCPMCKEPITGFKDKLSEKEYEISGLCQKCQDRMFAEPDHDT